MSGGPLINELGEVVGIVTLKKYEMKTLKEGTILVQKIRKPM